MMTGISASLPFLLQVGGRRIRRSQYNCLNAAVDCVFDHGDLFIDMLSDWGPRKVTVSFGSCLELCLGISGTRLHILQKLELGS